MSGAPLGDALARIVAWLELPVLVAALVALGLCALELGRFATELWRRRARARRGDDLVALARRALAQPAAAEELARAAPTAFAATALTRIGAAQRAGQSSAVEQALADYELAAQRRLDRTRLLVRAGPALGLMGTLIPLAPGLAELGRGDIAALAADLRVAFSATVIGLLVGSVAFALTLTRTRMYSADLVALERAAEAVRAGMAPCQPAASATPASATAATPAPAAAATPAPAPAPVAAPSAVPTDTAAAPAQFAVPTQSAVPTDTAAAPAQFAVPTQSAVPTGTSAADGPPEALP